MRAWLSLPALWLLCAPAWAASRVVVTLTEPATIYLDGQPQNGGMGGQRVVINGVAPGAHRVEVRDINGQVLHSGTLQVPDGAEVTATYGTGPGFVVTSPVGAESGAAAEGTGGGDTPDERPAADDQVASTFDTNEGSVTNAHVATEGRAGNPDGFNKTVNTGAQVARTAGTTVGLVSPTVAVATVAVPAAARGASSMVRNADAGGIDALRGGTSTFKQGRPIPPAAVTGYVEFQDLDGEPAMVYLEGFTIAAFARGDGKKKVKLEIGRHDIEIWDAETAQVRYKGVLQIDKDFTVIVAFSESQAPQATNRSWAWYAR